MLVIRLARAGRNKYPTYRIVAAESSRAATGKFVEILGHYNPHTKELVIQKERIQERLGHGAQPSNTVVKLLQREKVTLPEWVELKTRDRKPKKEPVTAEAAVPAAAKAASEEKPDTDAEKPEQAGETTAKATEDSSDSTAAAEERVAEAATENEAKIEDKAKPAGKTETAEDTEKAAEVAEAANNAGAKVVEEAAAEAKTEDKTKAAAKAQTKSPDTA